MSSVKPPTSFDDLPQELAAIILLRLPVKALIRSTSVSKQWYSLITNPNFISAQIKRAISQSDDNVVFIIPPFISQEKHCSLISAETSKVIEKYEIPFTTRSNTLKLLGSVNGLMLLTDEHMLYNSRELYLWNPCLKTHRTLVSSCFKSIISNHCRSYCIVGVGYNSSADDYRVVRIVYVADNKYNFFGEVAPRVEVYSLRKHTWKKIKDPVVPRIASHEGTYVNGSFYWTDNTKRELGILSFDFENEVFGELEMPKKFINCIGITDKHKLMEFEGSLALCLYDGQSSDGVVSNPYRIWLMRQENGVISWVLRFSAALKEGGCPIHITKRGTLLIEMPCPLPGLVDNRGILAFNLKTMHHKDLGFHMCWGVVDPLLRPDSCTVDTSFTESLVMYEGGKLLLKFAN